jgi:hypothetical protein
LKRHRLDWDPDEIHAWALANGWLNNGADDLLKYAAGVNTGKSFQTRSGYGLNPSVFEHWQQRASENS